MTSAPDVESWFEDLGHREHDFRLHCAHDNPPVRDPANLAGASFHNITTRQGPFKKKPGPGDPKSGRLRHQSPGIGAAVGAARLDQRLDQRLQVRADDGLVDEQGLCGAPRSSV